VIARGGSQEAWRWYARATRSTPPTINIIEPSPGEEPTAATAPGGVPVGFIRILHVVSDPPVMPLLWEGD
jgi:hypothetical protein